MTEKTQLKISLNKPSLDNIINFWDLMKSREDEFNSVVDEGMEICDLVCSFEGDYVWTIKSKSLSNGRIQKDSYLKKSRFYDDTDFSMEGRLLLPDKRKKISDYFYRMVNKKLDPVQEFVLLDKDKSIFRDALFYIHKDFKVAPTYSIKESSEKKEIVIDKDVVAYNNRMFVKQV